MLLVFALLTCGNATQLIDLKLAQVKNISMTTKISGTRI